MLSFHFECANIFQIIMSNLKNEGLCSIKSRNCITILYVYNYYPLRIFYSIEFV